MAAVTDPRIEAYARLIVERALDVQPGMQVLIRTTPLSRPLLEEIVRLIGRRGAYPLIRMGFTLWPTDIMWAEEAPLEVLERMPDVDVYASEHMDARVTIDAPENTRENASLPPEKVAAMSKRTAPFFRRSMTGEIPWMSCQFPTPALAQDAGMSTDEFADFLFDAVVLDWDAEGVKMKRLVERFDAAEEVRLVGAGTDLRLSLRGRRGGIDAGGSNLPAGEFYFAPNEHETQGVIEFGEFPAVHGGREVRGARLVFERGRVVEATAQSGQDVLVAVLDADEGARRVGELGIGCNPRITRYMKNTLFDEKIDGTVHLALGAAYEDVGGTNQSTVHWDLVKDMRLPGARIELDGEVVQQEGRWLL